jgi:hypothetical protein
MDRTLQPRQRILHLGAHLDWTLLVASRLLGDETLKDIGNTLGIFFKISEQTKTNKYTSYVRICIYMHISKALSDSIFLPHEDMEWIQTLDYEHVPFRWLKCHEHMHLFRYFPQNKPTTAHKDATLKDEDRFTTIPI